MISRLANFDLSSLSKMDMKVTAYVRVSTLGEYQSNSYNSQIKYFVNKINSNPHWILPRIYGDEGVSGTSIRNRKGFMKMIEDAEKGEFDLILTKSISRFARNTVDTLKYIRKLKGIGIGVYFEEEGIYSLDKKGEFTLTILGAIAEQESINISNHILRGKEIKMKQGVAQGRVGIFGYKYDTETKKMTIVPEEAKIVRKTYKLFLKGMKIAEIVRYLNHHCKRPDNKKISRENVMTFLKNEKYAGCVLIRKKIVIDPLTHKDVFNDGYKDKFLVKDHHEPIVSKETYNIVQDKLNHKRRIKL